MKVVFITGISSGFGKEISRVLAEKGHIVYGTVRSDCEIAPGVNALNLELTEPDSIKRAIDTVIKKEKRIDVIINNAGMHLGGAIEDCPTLIIDQVIETNFKGWVYVIQNALPHMRKQKSGTIINIGSIGGLMGLPFQGFYSSMKFAMEGLSEALRLELREFNIDVVVVNPGDFKTRNTETRIKTTNSESAYFDQFNKTCSIFENDEKKGGDPNILAQKISQIIDKKNPRQRYVIGSFVQKYAVLVKCYLPESWFRKIFSLFYGIK